MSGGVLAIFLLVVGARFLVPLLIPRYPLPAIIASLVLDGIDQTVFLRWSCSGRPSAH